MNKYQKAYQIAKAQHEVRSAEYIAYMQPYEYLIDGSEEDWDEYLRISATAPDEIETVQILRAAEDALIEWALNKVSKIAHIGEEKNAIEIVRNRGLLNMKYRQQVIDMAFRLA